MQELNDELESTRGQLEHAEQPNSTRNDGFSNFKMNMQQQGDTVDRNAAGVDRSAGMKSELTLDGNCLKANNARKRHNSDEIELDSQRKRKCPQVPSTESAEGDEVEE